MDRRAAGRAERWPSASTVFSLAGNGLSGAGAGAGAGAAAGLAPRRQRVLRRRRRRVCRHGERRPWDELSSEEAVRIVAGFRDGLDAEAPGAEAPGAEGPSAAASDGGTEETHREATERRARRSARCSTGPRRGRVPTGRARRTVGSPRARRARRPIDRSRSARARRRAARNAARRCGCSRPGARGGESTTTSRSSWCFCSDAVGARRARVVRPSRRRRKTNARLSFRAAERQRGEERRNRRTSAGARGRRAPGSVSRRSDAGRRKAEERAQGEGVGASRGGDRTGASRTADEGEQSTIPTNDSNQRFQPTIPTNDSSSVPSHVKPRRLSRCRSVAAGVAFARFLPPASRISAFCQLSCPAWPGCSSRGSERGTEQSPPDGSSRAPTCPGRMARRFGRGMPE